MAHGDCIGQYGYRTFSSSWNVLLDGAAIEERVRGAWVAL